MSDKEREALRQIVAMDPEGKRADDLGRAVRIARAALDATPAEPSAVELTTDDVRAAGGIVHRDGNIFFTNIDALNRAVLAAAKGKP
jgi:hypothetical protein